MAVDQLYQAAKMKAVYRGICEARAAGKEVKAACMILPTTFRKWGMGADEYSSAPIPHFLIGLKKNRKQYYIHSMEIGSLIEDVWRL